MKSLLSLSNYIAITTIAFVSIFASCGNKEQTPQVNNKIENASQNFKPQVLKDTIGGVFHEYYQNGNIKIKGVLKNGKRDGDWSYFYENGKLWSWGEYTEGVRNGASSVYYENGVLKMEGNYFNNKQIGLWKFYDESGKLKKEVNLDK